MMRLAYFVSHPIQYQAPLLRLIAQDPDIELKVFFYSDFSLKGYQDPGFGTSVKWDVPLIDGYDHEFLNCWGSDRQYSWWQQPIATNIYEVLKNGKFDAIWVHGWSWICSIQAILAAERLGIPVLMRGESNGIEEPNNPVKARVKRVFLNWLFHKVKAFLYIGTHNRRFYEGYRISQDQLFLVPYTVDNDFFQQKVSQAAVHRESFRESLNLAAGRRIILYAAKLTNVKRPKDLLAAYKLLSTDGVQEPEPYLLFVGDGILKSELETSARETGWNSIRFLGFRNQSELPAMYDLCDVFVLPSGFEPWGLAINEVMNAGKAVVVSDIIGCAIDLIGDRENGRIFSTGDIEGLRESLIWGLANSQIAGEKSLKRIQSWSFYQDLQGIKASLGAG
jgi:glycosyltransferase involved in cell wall biosynthesis